MVDEEVRNLLDEWGFSSLIGTFQDNEIDADAFRFLTVETIKELIPKVGPRLKFITCWNKYKEKECLNDDNIENDKSVTNKYITGDTLKDIDVVFEDFGNASTSTVSIASNSPIISSTASNYKNLETEISESTDAGIAFQEATKQSYAFKGLHNFEKACRKVYSLNLRQFLEMTDAGRYVLKINENEYMTRKARSVLVDVIINGLMSESQGGLKSIDFEILADKIVELFPRESKNTYYVPRIKGNSALRSRPVNARGKLVDKYRNLRKLYNVKILNGESREEDIHLPAATDLILESTTWLKYYEEPWISVLEHWSITYDTRRKSKASTVAEFLEEWPILKRNHASELIEQDFKKMFPENSMEIYKKWDTFCCKMSQRKKNVDKHTDELLTQLNGVTTEDEKHVLQISLLADLFPPKGKFKSWKFSISECRSTLINHLKVHSDIETFIEKRRTEYQKRGCRVQPYIIVVGDTLKNVDSYIVIDVNIHKANSVLQCFDLTFKAFHVLNAEYPVQSQHIWQLIQRTVYGITTVFDIKIPYVETLINEIESI